MLEEPDVRLVSPTELTRYRQLILIDLEFTCWESSIRDGWADPARPPEVVEIGIGIYSTASSRVLDWHAGLARPSINPSLSAYCLRLLQVTQAVIDQAPDLGTTLLRLQRWLVKHPVSGCPTCSWGTNDRRFLSADARRKGCPDPFLGVPHFDVHAAWQAALPGSVRADRDSLRAILGLAPNPHRHRALEDALELPQFLEALSRFV